MTGTNRLKFETLAGDPQAFDDAALFQRDAGKVVTAVNAGESVSMGRYQREALTDDAREMLASANSMTPSMRRHEVATGKFGSQTIQAVNALKGLKR